MYTINKKQGLVKMIIVIVIALLILSYYGFDLEQLVKNPTTQKNFNYLEKTVLYIWQNVLKTPIMYVWNIFVDLIWQPALQNLTNIKNGGNASFNVPNPQLPQTR
ncbi:MAG: hypothetical protein EXS50_01525 [Candidatus Taylorbacteria bacterium]|nr:hypothetical protein [Candidatus Taylorbacteria bacterium]